MKKLALSKGYYLIQDDKLGPGNVPDEAIWTPRLNAWSLPIRSFECLDWIDSYCTLGYADNRTEGVSPSFYMWKTMPWSQEPWRHQRIALALALSQPKTGLFMDMSTGKTRTAVNFVRARMLLHKVEKALIVCPLGVKSVWEGEILSNGINKPLILSGTTEEKLDSLSALRQIDKAFSPGDKVRWRYVIVNVDSVPLVLDVLKKFKWDIVIVDESTTIKNKNAERSKAVGVCAKGSESRMILTGTPAVQSPLDFFGQFHFLDNTVFGNSKQAFMNEYAYLSFWGGYPKVEKWKNLEKIQAKIAPYVFSIKAEECIDLPEFIEQTRHVELSEPQKKLYNQLEEEFIAWITEDTTVTAALALTRSMKLAQVCGGWIKTDDGKWIPCAANSKLDVLSELLEEIGDKKVVVWARFTPEVKGIAEKFGGLPYYGEVDEIERQVNLQQFQEDPKVKMLVGNPATGGLGISLTAANVVVYYSNDWKVITRIQSEARVHRVGQKNKVECINLIVPNTIDEVMLKTIKENGNLGDRLIEWAWEKKRGNKESRS